MAVLCGVHSATLQHRVKDEDMKTYHGAEVMGNCVNCLIEFSSENVCCCDSFTTADGMHVNGYCIVCCPNGMIRKSFVEAK